MKKLIVVAIVLASIFLTGCMGVMPYAQGSVGMGPGGYGGYGNVGGYPAGIGNLGVNQRSNPRILHDHAVRAYGGVDSRGTQWQQPGSLTQDGCTIVMPGGGGRRIC